MNRPPGGNLFRWWDDAIECANVLARRTGLAAYGRLYFGTGGFAVMRVCVRCRRVVK